MTSVVQHATVPSASEMRDEAVGAVVQHATVPSASEMRDEEMDAAARVQLYPLSGGAVAQQRATVPSLSEYEMR